MIKTLTELVAFTHHLAKLDSQFNDSKLDMPGCSEPECDRLRSALPNLPDSYLACCRSVTLKRKSIGYFLLWPGDVCFDSLAESVIDVNDPVVSGFAPFAHHRNTYIVAANEAEPICVAQATADHPGGAVFQMSVASPDFELFPIADDFETFLLIVGNLYAVRTQYKRTGSGARERAMKDFAAVLDHFQSSSEARATWKFSAEETFGRL